MYMSSLLITRKSHDNKYAASNSWVFFASENIHQANKFLLRMSPIVTQSCLNKNLPTLTSVLFICWYKFQETWKTNIYIRLSTTNKISTHKMKNIIMDWTRFICTVLPLCLLGNFVVRLQKVIRCSYKNLRVELYYKAR